MRPRIGRRKGAGTRRARGVTGREKERGVTKKSEGAAGVRSLEETKKRTVEVREIGRRRGTGAAETRIERGEDLEIERGVAKREIELIGRRAEIEREIGAIGRRAETERGERGRRIERGGRGRGEAAVGQGGRRGNAK